MRRITILVLIIFCSIQVSLSQNITADQLKSSGVYLTGTGRGATVEEAKDKSVADLVSNISVSVESDFEYVFVDEAQFLTEEQVQEMADMASGLEIFCYGLKTDFMGNFFPGSAALLRLAEDIQEVTGSLCWCGAKATMNTRVDPEGNVIKQGAQVLIDTQGNQKPIRYIGLCYKHWREGRSHG